MRWPRHQQSEARHQLDRVLIQAAELRIRLAEAVQQSNALRAELARERRATETVVDNALFAAGAAPIFDPQHRRFQPRTMEQQQAEAQRSGRVLSAAEWRRQIEDLDRQAAERDRRGKLAEELKALADERRTQAQG